MIKVLANDGISERAKAILEKNGFSVDTDTLSPEALADQINNYDVLLVRSATKVRQELIDQGERLKLIGRGGVGLDNIDVDYARSKDIAVVNTPAASSQSVAELVMAHLYTGARHLHAANRKMPSEGHTNFKALKKAYKGTELQGKTLGIIGFGRIGQAVAKLALGAGMRVKAHDKFIQEPVSLSLYIQEERVQVSITPTSFEEVLHCDCLTLHVPFSKEEGATLDAAAFDKMKDGIYLINASRGGVVDEDALLSALQSGKVAFAGIDVFENEPSPREDLLQHPNVSLTPHIGASTAEGQERVWAEMAETLIRFFNK